jgi:hypothetical protein
VTRTVNERLKESAPRIAPEGKEVQLAQEDQLSRRFVAPLAVTAAAALTAVTAGELALVDFSRDTGLALLLGILISDVLLLVLQRSDGGESS